MIMNYYRKIDKSRVQFDFLLTVPGHYDFEEEIKELGGHIYRVSPLTKNHPRDYMKDVDRFFKEHPQYRIVHSHTSSKSYFPLRLAKKNGVPVRIAHSHSTRAEKGINGIIRKALRLPLRTVATDFFSCGDEASVYLYGEKIAREKAVVLPNAIDSRLYRFDAAQARRIRQSLGLDNQFVIGNVGRFFPLKNHMFIIDIFHAVKQLHPESRLLLCGDGELRKAVEKKASDLGLSQDIVFTGVRSDIPRLLMAMDVFLFPSIEGEGLPVAMLEAQASGLQCFMSDCVPVQCVITQNVKRLPLSQPPEHWAREILRLKDGYERRDMLSDIEKAGFDINSNAKWLEEFYLQANERG